MANLISFYHLIILDVQKQSVMLLDIANWISSHYFNLLGQS